MISQGKKVIEERLQRKREQCIHQKEKLEQMKCTMQKTEEEVEQLEYVLHEIEHIEKSKREPRVIPNADISVCLFLLIVLSASYHSKMDTQK
jgi:hypothetical protein